MNVFPEVLNDLPLKFLYNPRRKYRIKSAISINISLHFQSVIKTFRFASKSVGKTISFVSANECACILFSKFIEKIIPRAVVFVLLKWKLGIRNAHFEFRFSMEYSYFRNGFVIRGRKIHRKSLQWCTLFPMCFFFVFFFCQIIRKKIVNDYQLMIFSRACACTNYKYWCSHK